MQVRKLRFPTATPPVALVGKMLDSENIPFHTLDYVNWKAYPYKPEVQFRLAYSRNELYLQFNVREKNIRAKSADDETCEPWKDSCVELFIAPAGDGIYYNIEFNCIGACLLAYGKGRHERHRLGRAVTSLIRRSSSLGNEPFDERSGNFEWTLTAAIPFGIFTKHKIDSLEGRELRANIYKCGDELKEPHFVTWHPVNTEQPDYHRPDFFGMLTFEH